MIGRIKGFLEYKSYDHAVIDVNGIGYEIYFSDLSLMSLPKPGSSVSVFTELIVREDLLQLVGFISVYEREWYRLLTSVQGVGSKAALKILGSINLMALSRAILIGDADTIKATPGIGPKIAQRIVVELKDKAPSVMAIDGGPEEYSESDSSDKAKTKDTNFVHDDTLVENSSKKIDNFSKNKLDYQSQVLSALTNLGYSQADAAIAITKVQMEHPDAMELSELIKLALKRLGSKE